MPSSSSKKYKLFSADAAAAGVKPICAFFNSPAGCRNGDSCKFLHELQPTAGGTTPTSKKKQNNNNDQRIRKESIEISETSSVVSSESEGDTEVVTKVADDTKNSNSSTKKKVETFLDSEDDPFASPNSGGGPPQKQQQQQSQEGNGKNKKKRKSRSENRDLFANGKEESNSSSKPSNIGTAGSSGKTDDGLTTPAPRKRQKQQAASTKTPTATSTSTAKDEQSSTSKSNDFSRLLAKLPVASFSIPGVTPQTTSSTPSSGTSTPSNKDPSTPRSDAPKKEENEKKKETTTTKVSSTPPSTKKKISTILPTSTEVGRDWKDVVVKTRQHGKYASAFDFDRYKDLDKEAGIPSTWVKTKPFGPWCKDNPQAIAIDCEMCESQDPLTGVKNHRALCRLSVVNAEQPDQVLLDTLVKPSWPITNYRTWINGVTKESMDNVEFTLRHAQAFMMALCSEETVIVGHAVQNDLAAMNIEHEVVADSSFLFRAKDSDTAIVSLKDTVKSVMGADMPNTHDSVNDARKALECVLHYKEKKGNVEPVQRTPKQQPPRHSSGGNNSHSKGHQLFVHRIPKMCKTEHLSKMFFRTTSIEPTDVEDINFLSGDTGKTFVSFKSVNHANLAFDSLDGKADADKSGKLQKKVYLRNGDYVRVRKMIQDGP